MPKRIILPNHEPITCDDIIKKEEIRTLIRIYFRKLVNQMDKDIFDLATLLLFDLEDEDWLLILYLRNARKDLVIKEEDNEKDIHTI